MKAEGGRTAWKCAPCSGWSLRSCLAGQNGRRSFKWRSGTLFALASQISQVSSLVPKEQRRSRGDIRQSLYCLQWLVHSFTSLPRLTGVQDWEPASPTMQGSFIWVSQHHWNNFDEHFTWKHYTCTWKHKKNCTWKQYDRFLFCL